MSGRSLRPKNKDISYLEVPPDDLNTSFSSSKASSCRNPRSKSDIQNVTKCHSRPSATSLLSHSSKNKSPFELSDLPTLPYFDPIRHPVPLYHAINTLPSSITSCDIIEPNDIMKLFLTDELISIMTHHTNLYAEAKAAGVAQGTRDWRPIVPGELRVWIGMIIYMGIFSGKSSSIREFWVKDGLHPAHDTSRFMSETRFEQIKRYFHISHPDAPKTSPQGERLWHHKVDPILDQLRESSQSYRIPSSNLTIDEAMIRCTGRSADTVKMPNKPIELGFKFHCLANRDYIIDFIPTSNTSKLDPVPSV